MRSATDLVPLRPSSPGREGCEEDVGETWDCEEARRESESGEFRKGEVGVESWEESERVRQREEKEEGGERKSDRNTEGRRNTNNTESGG